MRFTPAIFAFIVMYLPVSAQYYLRGEIKDEKNNTISNARIKLHSSGYLYYSGVSGSFGILGTKMSDSLTITMIGYQPLTVKIETGRYHTFVLKMLYASANLQRNRLVSLTRDLRPEDRRMHLTGGETYSALVENDFVTTKKYPETGFAIHNDRAAYSNIRRFLNMNTTVPPDAVRTEEMLSYFNFDYTPPPSPDSIFGFRSYLSVCPWNTENWLLYLNVCAKKIDTAKYPPSNLVFLVDISGSMDMPNRLPLLKSSFKLLVNNLRATDTLSIVVYGSTVGVWLPPTSGKEKEKIRKSIEELYPGGGTPGESGIRTAYRLARSQFIKGGNNRVILATDGDFNIGQSSEEELEKLITLHQESGIYLTCLGVGMGNYKDSKLEVLAKKGNGNFAYLDTEQEGEKVLVKELTQTLYTVADDAYLNMHFDPSLVRSYRLIGFDNKLKALADTLTEVEGGEVGPGHSMMVLFEISPVMQASELNSWHEREGIAKVTVNYQIPGSTIRKTTGYVCPGLFTEPLELPACYRFASSVAMFGSLLKGSKFSRQISWSDVIDIAQSASKPDNAMEKEYIGMVVKAKKIYSKMRKKRKVDEDR